jgi:hypothetical protein
LIEDLTNQNAKRRIDSYETGAYDWEQYSGNVDNVLSHSSGFFAPAKMAVATDFPDQPVLRNNLMEFMQDSSCFETNIGKSITVVVRESFGSSSDQDMIL